MEKDKGRKIAGVHADVYDRAGDAGISVSFSGGMPLIVLAIGHLLHDVYSQFDGTQKDFMEGIMAAWAICDEFAEVTKARHETTAFSKDLREILKKAAEDSKNE